MKKILIADDDEEIALLISDALTDEGYSTVCVHDGTSAIQAVKSTEFDLILLDVMMPNTDGHTVCRKIRSDVSCPIIFVSAKNRSEDMLLGFDMGADDYIEKPFDLEILTAKVRARLNGSDRRAKKAPHVTSYGEIKINKDEMYAEKNGISVCLSPRELQLLCYLAENEGKTLSKEEIYKAVWESDYGDVGAVAVHIKHLREKIDPSGKYIKTVWGSGYRFIVPTEDKK